MAREAVDILVQTAWMWADLGFWRGNSVDVFHIHGVTGPDEYTTVVNDNLFTNVMARFNLRQSAMAVRDLQVSRTAMADCRRLKRAMTLVKRLSFTTVVYSSGPVTPWM